MVPDQTFLALDTLLDSSPTYDEAVTKLSKVENAPYALTILPLSAILELDPVKRDWEFQKFAKVQYDFLQLQLKCGQFTRGGNIKIRKTNKLVL